MFFYLDFKFGGILKFSKNLINIIFFVDDDDDDNNWDLKVKEKK